MKSIIESLLADAAAALDIPVPPAARVENTRDRSHGDLASNLALVAAKPLGRKPRDLAAELVAALPAHDAVVKAEIAGPGFINFTLRQDSYLDVLREIHEQGERYGHHVQERPARVLVEFVSANPTGPLHVGHGRGAAYGDCLVRLLRAAGDQVDAEYYVNDAGRQMDILALSVWLRYMEQAGAAVEFPRKAYQGDYIGESAQRLRAERGDKLEREMSGYFDALPPDDDNTGDSRLDAMIERARERLGEHGFNAVLTHILREQVDDIRGDLAAFDVHMDRWASERDVVESGAVKAALDKLAEGGHTYERDGALWFRSSAFGDDKDRVLLRANRTATYFANDIAYHLDKLDRGYDRLIDVWGADHHGYVKRMDAAVQALTGQADKLDVQLVQFVNLMRAGEKVSMSTRAATYETLEDLREDVGRDAARYFYVMRSNDQHLDFDLELAKQQSNENPVYYVQYAHARIHSVLRQLADKGWSFDANQAAAVLDRLDQEIERDLMAKLQRFGEVVGNAARQLAPQLVVNYLRELAEIYHRYYNSSQFLVDDEALRNARLYLNVATRQVLRNGLSLLGVTHPEEM